jgi:lysophospholipase L1-like esterase
MTRSVFAIGDSVMQGAGPELYATLPALIPGIEVDAAPNRQLRHAPAIVRARLDRGATPDVVVVHLGTNGLFSNAVFDELMSAASDISTIVFVAVRAPREWETEVNRRLIDGVERHASRTSLLDWWSIADGDPDLLRKDGFHLSRVGAVVYAEAIAASVRPGSGD